jgi:hypothetical protein
MFGGSMTLQGKGFFTSLLSECEGGDPGFILAAAQAAGLSHMIVKIADGGEAFGVDAGGMDYTSPVVQVLRMAGIAAWGWHPIHGINPSAEAAIAIARTQALHLDGYVVEVEKEYKNPGMEVAARQFMAAVRSALTIPIALSSYRFPDFHPELPWSTFLEFCDLHMPQVAWEHAHDAGAQLRESLRQCDALPNARPFIPTGMVFAASDWSPSAEEIQDFLNTAQSLGLPAVNFFNWDACRQKLPLLWTTITDFAWPVPASGPAQVPPVSPADAFLAQFMAALLSRQAVKVSAQYAPFATQVWADEVRSGAAVIEAGYAAFFSSLPSGTVITISQAREQNDARMLSWKAGELAMETTLVVKNGKIVLDYTFIT